MLVDFYCKKCELDQTLPSRLESNRWVEWYSSKCYECGIILIRQKDNSKDPYYRESKKLKIQREKLKIDLIQPGDSRFKTHYKKSWDENEAAAERQEKKKKEEEIQRDVLIKEFGYNEDNKKVIKKIYQDG